jgi:hypothetical protein
MLTGAPTGVFKLKDYANKTQELFDLLKETFSKNYLHMGHLTTPKYGLEEMHAYSLLGVYELLDDITKEVKHRVIRIANPHGTDGNYTGAFRDNDTIWSESFRK